jgi:hypothetical protein
MNALCDSMASSRANILCDCHLDVIDSQRSVKRLLQCDMGDEVHTEKSEIGQLI